MLGSLSGTMDSGLLVLLGVLCLVMVVLTWVRRARERGVSVRDATREQRARLKEEREVQQSLGELLAQLEGIADHVGGQVDTRIEKLQKLIGEADERIERLERAGRVSELVAASNAELPDATAQVVVAQGDPTDQEAVAHGQSRSEKFRRIYELADAGTPAIAIADALGLPLGEVELILSVRRYKTAVESAEAGAGKGAGHCGGEALGVGGDPPRQTGGQRGQYGDSAFAHRCWTPPS